MAHGTERKTNKFQEQETAEYQRKLTRASFGTRIASIFVALLGVGVLNLFLKVSVPSGVVIVFVLWLVVSILYLKVFNLKVVFSERAIDNIHFSYYLPGVLLATFLVHYLGGAEWIAFFIYFFDLLYANMLLKRKRGKVVTFGILACYLLLIFLEYSGIIPHYRLIPMYESAYNNAKYIMSTNVLAVGMMFILVAYVTGLFSKIKRDREMDLLRSQKKEEIKARQLEELSNSFKLRDEENELLKSRAAEYIKEKEKQLSLVKKDLEEQIETLRKTQKAMRFMIEDLNKMSRELKKVKDNLEEKVKERTEELMEISAKLHRSEKLAFLGKLAGSITHELRNPMAVIKNAAYFLESKLACREDEKVKEYMRIIMKGIDSINVTIDDIMSFARTKPVELEKKDLRSVVEGAISYLEIPELIKIKKEFKNVPDVMVSEKQLIHAICNIASNAIIAMKGNGVLGFTVFQKENNVCVGISDTGGGIPKEYQEIIFEPLYSSRPRGTGLGLSIAKMMVENQNGEIFLESKVGVGTTFIISIPIAMKCQ